MKIILSEPLFVTNYYGEKIFANEYVWMPTLDGPIDVFYVIKINSKFLVEMKRVGDVKEYVWQGTIQRANKFPTGHPFTNFPFEWSQEIMINKSFYDFSELEKL